MQNTITIDMLRSLVKTRPEDGHKGTFGHALLVAGSYGMAGASILAARGCMRSGVGKLTVHIPANNNDIMQIAVPESILHHDESRTHWTSPLPTHFDALGIGPGIGRHKETASALHMLLSQHTEHSTPMVVDADALNLLAENPEWFELLPENAIVTPHPLELKRLVDAGIATNRVVLIEKGHRTKIHLPGTTNVYECPWGNSGMGTAGSGDVLTGIILGLLAQGYRAEEAALLGVSLHAISGDMAAEELGQHSLIASDLIENIHKAFKLILEVNGYGLWVNA